MEELRSFYSSVYVSTSKVSTGACHTAIITNEGKLYTFGYGKNGQLGTGDREGRLYPTLISFPEKVKSVSAGDFMTAVITESGKLYTFGSNMFGQLGTGDNRDRLSPTLIPFPEAVIIVSVGG